MSGELWSLLSWLLVVQIVLVALLALGGAVAMVSLLGLLSTRPSGLGRCLLPLYMLCLGLIGLCLVALEVSACGQGGVYTQAGLASLDAELDEHWVLMRDDLGLTMSKADFVAAMSRSPTDSE